MQQSIVFAILISALALFLTDRIRYDLVALLALLAVVLTGVLPSQSAFKGFAHPAVITVAAVMVISRGMQNSGLIDLLARWMQGLGRNLSFQIMALSLLTAFASAFMNNVGALAIMMPIAIKLAKKTGYSPSRSLMPIAFASLLGGLITLIGTPPNIIIATFRADTGNPPFGMFDFASLGLPMTIAGIVFIAVIGWRLIPARKEHSPQAEIFEIDDYITEVLLTEDTNIIGNSIRDLMRDRVYDITIIGMIRNKLRVHIPDPDDLLDINDILIIEADSENLKSFVDRTKVKLLGEKELHEQTTGDNEIALREVVVTQDSLLVGRSACQVNLRSHYRVNLLAIARGERKITKRISQSKFRVGDVLLLQGRTQQLTEVVNAIGCIPLAERGFRIGDESRIALTLGIFGSAIGLVVVDLLRVEIAFTSAAVLLVLSKVVSLRELYQSVDWSVIVLLGAMIPVGMALEASGGADSVASILLKLGGAFPLSVSITLIMLVTMLLSNVINNAATAVLMAPIGIHLASGLNTSADVFLMAVAIAASSAFMTPIGHQSNTLVMGPGGYKFSDYWRMGLPLQILVIAVSVPLLIRFWG